VTGDGVVRAQRHRWLGERGTKSEQLLIETDAVYDDIPYGDCFQVATEFSFKRQQAAAPEETVADSTAVQVSVRIGIRWLKSTW
jgi:hypothetical protein